MPQLVALGLNNTPVNALGAFAEGQQQQQTFDMNKVKTAAATLETVGSAAMYALNGDVDGEPDPDKWNEVLDFFQQQGIPVDSYRNPGMAKVAAHASISALDRLKLVQSDRDFQLLSDKFQADLAQNAVSNDFNERKLLLDQQEAEQKLAGGDDVGLQPLFGRDAEGNVVVLQPTKSGKIVRSEMPEGVTVDLGVKSQEGARGRVVGGAAGGASVSLVGADENFERVSKQIKEIKEDPDLDVVLGTFDSSTPNLTPRSNRVQSKIDQIKGEAFLQARQMLKGGGAITDYEGEKAERAYARMNQAQSAEDFKMALDDFESAVKMGLKKLKAQAQLDLGSGGDVSDDEGYIIREK